MQRKRQIALNGGEERAKLTVGESSGKRVDAVEDDGA